MSTLKAGLKSTSGRFVRMLVAVVLAVGFTSLVFFAQASATTTLTGAINGIVNADVYVSAKGSSVADILLKTNAQRSYLASSVTATVRGLPEVQAVLPVYAGPVVLENEDGQAVSSGLAPSIAIGADVDQTGMGHLVGDGALPAESIDEIALEEETARRAGLEVGDVAKVIFNGTTLDRARVVGIVSFDTSVGGATIVILNPTTARSMFVPANTVSFLAVKAATGIPTEQLRNAITPALEAAAEQGSDINAEAVLGSEVREQAISQADSSLRLAWVVLIGVAGLAVVAGGLIVAATVAETLRRQRAQIATVKALGATRGQIVRHAVGRAALAGFIGSLIGVGVGFGAWMGLRVLVTAAGVDLGFGIPWVGLVVCLLVGMGVAIAAAWWGARRISGVGAMEVTEGAREPKPSLGVVRVILGFVLILAGGAGLYWGLRDSIQQWFVFGGVAAVLLGFVLAAPVLISILAPVVGLVLRLFSSVPARLATKNLRRHPRPAGNAAGVFIVTLSLASVMLILAASSSGTGRATVEEGINANYVMTSTTPGGMISDAVVNLANANAPSPIIMHVFGQAPVQVVLPGDDSDEPAQATVMYGPAETFVSVSSAPIVEGTGEAFSASVAVSQAYATAHGLSVGDDLSFTVAPNTPFTTTASLPVGLIVDTAAFQDMLVPVTWIATVLDSQARAQLMPATMVFIELSSAGDEALTYETLQTTIAPYRTIQLESRDAFLASASGNHLQILVIVYLLAALCIVVAFAALARVLASAVSDQSAQIGTWKALGMSDGQVKRTFRFESVIIAVIGSLVGVGLGIGLAFVARKYLADFGMNSLSLPWLWLGILVVGGILIGILGATGGARRAARVDIIDAIR